MAELVEAGSGVGEGTQKRVRLGRGRMHLRQEERRREERVPVELHRPR
jgi:hypothetical protein